MDEDYDGVHLRVTGFLATTDETNWLTDAVDIDPTATVWLVDYRDRAATVDHEVWAFTSEGTVVVDR